MSDLTQYIQVAQAISEDHTSTVIMLANELMNGGTLAEQIDIFFKSDRYDQDTLDYTLTNTETSPDGAMPDLGKLSNYSDTDRDLGPYILARVLEEQGWKNIDPELEAKAGPRIVERLDQLKLEQGYPQFYVQGVERQPFFYFEVWCQKTGLKSFSRNST